MGETVQGCLLLWNDGMSVSHSNKELNKMKTDFVFSFGDVIEDSTHGDQLLFMNETKKK